MPHDPTAITNDEGEQVPELSSARTTVEATSRSPDTRVPPQRPDGSSDGKEPDTGSEYEPDEDEDEPSGVDGHGSGEEDEEEGDDGEDVKD